jgi:hypothetical protein
MPCAVPTNADNVGFSAFNRAHFGQQWFGLVVVEGWLNACEDAEAVTDVLSDREGHSRP